MPAGPVVANNTPLVALSTLGRLDLLRDLFQEVLVLEAVRVEFLAVDRSSRNEILVAAPWLKIASLGEKRRALAYIGLDQGEAEVLALAEERDARLVILDEKKARRYGQRMGFPVTGTIGVLLLAKEKGLIGSLRGLLEELQNSGLYLGQSLIARALELAGESSREEP